jgi:anti-sigma-K factor RskA
VSVQSHELHLLTGAYAVDALTDEELDEFERHLSKCPSCTEEVRELRETAARLGMTTALEPPPWMREKVLAAANRTRQLPPAGGRLLDRDPVRRLTRLRRTWPRTIIGVAVAAAIVALGVFQVNTQDQLEQAQQRNSQVAAVLAAPDAHLVHSSTAVGGTVTAVISGDDREAVITTADMPALADAKVYQFWVMNAAGGARSVGLLAGSGGVSSPVLAADVQPGDRLGITVEPAGGTSRPTTTPIMTLSVRD